MNSTHITYLLFLSLLLFKHGLSQDSLFINGAIKTNECIKINITDQSLENNQSQRVKIYHAEITNNCLAIGILYPKDKSTIEFITDDHLIEGPTLTLNFLLYYLESNKNEANNKTTLYFDLTPFKNKRNGQYLVINLIGESYQLIYK